MEDGMNGRFRFHIFIFTFLGMLAFSGSARAWPTYFEFGGTMATLADPAPLFQSEGKGSSNTASSSFGVPLTFGVPLQESQHGLLFALALQTRYLSGTTGTGETFTAIPISPMLRLEFWRLVIGAGYTTYVAKDLAFKKDSTIDSALTLEAQFLFPITPEIDFGLQAARTAFQSSRYGNGSTVMEYGAFFRLNFGLTDAMSNERHKFKGWRYPLGSPLH
jgi:hypothetical protein